MKRRTVVRATLIALFCVGGYVAGRTSGPGLGSTEKQVPTRPPASARAALTAALRADTRTGPDHSATALTWNWGGYAVTSGGFGGPDDTIFTAASGTWRIPEVTCPQAGTRGVGAEDTIVADWVGLDGFNDLTVEQLGTSSQCFNGHAYYYTWYEMYPNATVSPGQDFPIAQLASAGDTVTASITTTVDGDAYKMVLTDTQHPAVSFNVTRNCDYCSDSSAEWVVERPAYGIGVVPEADFQRTTFSNIRYTSDGANHGYVMDTIDATDTYYLQVSSQPRNHSFTSEWKGSY